MGTLRLTLQRHQDGVDPSPGGVLFFACPKKRTKRKGSPAAETTPVDGLRNRRGKNSLRSDSLPLFPGSAPRRPAQRQRAVVLPRKPILPRTVRPGGASLPPHDRKFRGGLIVPTPQSQSGLGNAGRAPEGATIARSIPMGSFVLCRSPALRAILAPPAPQHHCPPGRLPPWGSFPRSSVGTETRALQRHQDGVDPSPGGVLFFACPKKRTKRKGSPAAETTPIDGLRNRRGKNSLRSNSLPLYPGSAPRRPAQRQRAVFFPGNPSGLEPSSWRGQPSNS